MDFWWKRHAFQLKDWLPSCSPGMPLRPMLKGFIAERLSTESVYNTPAEDFKFAGEYIQKIVLANGHHNITHGGSQQKC